jgi:beta-lactamase class C
VRAGVRSLKRKIVYTAASALLLLFVFWAATHISFSRAPAEPKLGISDAELSAISERQSAKDLSVDYARVDRRLQALMQASNMIGLAVGIVEGGQIRFLKGYGETVAGSGDPVTPNTLFRWASVSKGVAGDMVAVLAAENKLSLTDPIARYETSLRLPAGDEYRATVADVLSHRLGLPGHANDPKLEDGMDPHILRASLAQLNAACSPGTCWAYQNVAYDTASELVEKITGKTYEEAVKERLFFRLGMRSASMNRNALVTAASWARPYVGSKKSKPVEVSEAYYRVPAAGGVNSSIKDLAIWMQAQMGLSPAVIPPQALDAVQTALVPTARELSRLRKFRERVHSASYGLGWRIYDYAGHRIIGHRGGVKGYRSLILFDPELKSGVVALWNGSSNQPGGLEFEVMDMIYHLEPRDWLGLDTRAAPEQPEPEAVTNASVDAGG